MRGFVLQMCELNKYQVTWSYGEATGKEDDDVDEDGEE
jgi:hypothetical protein